MDSWNCSNFFNWIYNIQNPPKKLRGFLGYGSFFSFHAKYVPSLKSHHALFFDSSLEFTTISGPSLLLFTIPPFANSCVFF